MSTSVSFGKEGSDESTQNDTVNARDAAWQAVCADCEGRVIADGVEAVCSECGLVIAVDALERSPAPQTHGPADSERSDGWAVETMNQLRVDKGLHTTFSLQTDGKGNQLSTAQHERMRRLKRRHKRFTMHNDRDKRLNEGFRDIGLLGANLALPEHVTTQAARYLETAKAERLPGGKMAWESLAAAAVLLAARAAGIERSPAEVARYAKTSRERLCAAARKLRVQTDIAVPPACPRAVETVVGALEERGVGLETGLALARVARELMAVADAEPVGPGTPRWTVAGAAVYVADTRTAGKAVTQRDVVAAVEETVSTSRKTLRTYVERLEAAAPPRRRQTERMTGQAAAD